MTVSLPPFEPLVPSYVYTRLSLVLTAVGLLFMAMFFMIEVTSSRSKYVDDSNRFHATVARVLKEVSIALIASTFLGFGLLFLCLCVGIYV
ncbi:Transmembrane protein 258-like protein [Dinothrombium tinctorium]|uniref:Dolichyl-diphosphooligosaccharide-protein glycosyltransferase subunit TMEM258 n=1 Tax=Dinothrombium tinctorium TaxID=1965070 RepID=A0A3S3PD69_9ACAR|nr:Transmembrane protein 258-like protein [Dinothrombium tinctorium]RWS12865.1 Transmembrane protein 258-like protein [Dinothrombium tinctorium]